MTKYELEVEPNAEKTEKEQAKNRLEYLLTDYVLPQKIEERQKIYTEIYILLERVRPMVPERSSMRARGGGR